MSFARGIRDRVAFGGRLERAENDLLEHGVGGERRSSSLAGIANHEATSEDLGARKRRREKGEEKADAHGCILTAGRFAFFDAGIGGFKGYNTGVKSPAWIPALIVAAAIHGALVMPLVPNAVRTASTVRQLPANTAEQIILAVAVGWCVIASVWCALVANVLSRPDNRWHGLSGLRLVGIVAGLTLAMDVVNSPCLWFCPPAALAVPILSYVAISNVSAPLEVDQSAKKS